MPLSAASTRLPGAQKQIMGHRPSATAEKRYGVRPLNLLRKWQTELEAWILTEPVIEQPRLNTTRKASIKSKRMLAATIDEFRAELLGVMTGRCDCPAGVAVLKRALDVQSAGAMALLQAVPANLPLDTSGTLGTQVNQLV